MSNLKDKKNAKNFIFFCIELLSQNDVQNL